MIDFLATTIKQRKLSQYDRHPSDHKVFRLFQEYGTELPCDVIKKLQEVVGKLANRIEKEGNARSLTGYGHDDYDFWIDFCHERIECGLPKGESYKLGAGKMCVSDRAFINQYKKKYPTQIS